MNDRRQNMHNNPGSLPLGELIRYLIAANEVDRELLCKELDRREHDEYRKAAGSPKKPLPNPAEFMAHMAKEFGDIALAAATERSESGGWVSLSTLKPGDAFETKAKRIGTVAQKQEYGGYVNVCGAEGTVSLEASLTVRRLIVVRDDGETVDEIARVSQQASAESWAHTSDEIKTRARGIAAHVVGMLRAKR